MRTLLFQIPPFPTFITGGRGTFRKGKRHFRRIYTVFDCLYVQKGKLYMTEDDREYEISEGQYMILVPEFEHFGHKDCIENTEFYWFHFESNGGFSIQEKQQLNWTDVLQSEETFTEPAQFLLQIPQYGQIQNREMGERLLEELVHGRNSTSVEEKLKQPLTFYQFLLFVQKEALVIPSAAEKVSELTASYIRLHYKEDLKMVNVAKHLHYHTDYITRCMQKTMGITPLQYVNEIRLLEAKRKLALTMDKIKHIAYESGFHDEAYFSRLFRKKEGMSPQEYRRMMQREGWVE
ncbi:AraC family transcriptional regulator [Ectobacillus polymachus]|uniref:AraC family transcriptional regulator n=1 Tax=Ectobacillus polymachus TaxID=1508806 RepID=UPI003A879839